MVSSVRSGNMRAASNGPGSIQKACRPTPETRFSHIHVRAQTVIIAGKYTAALDPAEQFLALESGSQAHRRTYLFVMPSKRDAAL